MQSVSCPLRVASNKAECAGWIYVQIADARTTIPELGIVGCEVHVSHNRNRTRGHECGLKPQT